MVNYQQKLDMILKELEKEKTTPKILLHSCCAPCSSYVITYLSGYFAIDLLYYNPNIMPIEEYNKRKSEQIRFLKEVKTKNPINFIDSDYDNENFLKLIKGYENEKEGGTRCHICYRLRLEAAAKAGRARDCGYFLSTLSVSPYKNAQIINEIGEELSKIYGIKHLPNDFKKRGGYQKSIELSKEYNLYRQNYCGCVFSKRDEI
ncbi:MAG: epoxyqueuosine reductase QueH [Clostridiaceae bacterium]|nr:epoxyqueuosine reductase QueH [Clostridiaceae bacterium]